VGLQQYVTERRALQKSLRIAVKSTLKSISLCHASSVVQDFLNRAPNLSILGPKLKTSRNVTQVLYNMSYNAQTLQLCCPCIAFRPCKIPEPNSTSTWRYVSSTVAYAQVEVLEFWVQISPNFKNSYLLNHRELEGETGGI
jgi:hypothetical protein